MEKTGVVTDNGESYVGVRSIASAVVPYNRSPGAPSVSISAFGSGVPLERFTPLVIQAARKIALGLA